MPTPITMPGAHYIYPNVTEVAQRGGLLERWRLAEPLECTHIEVPADFIKNRTEVERTGQDIGSFLTRASIETLYEQETGIPYTLEYALHTESGIPRTDPSGRPVRTHLKWHDPEWVEAFGDMLIEIADYLGVPPDIIEIHPGDRKNTPAHIAQAVYTLVAAHRNAFGVEPLVLLENRGDQSIATAGQIRSFWTALTGQHPEVAEQAGIELDVQHLYAAAGADFFSSLRQIPPASLKAFTIHHNLTPPSLQDEIPWSQAFGMIGGLADFPLIKPEVYQKSRVPEAIDFCERMLAARVPA
jgi:hypothetical protein